ncbi:MAG: rRNA pseudouridine synthase [Syntrophaceae bacterium]|nr:rRNA pseudouridine synthase [Syntrophaceae bacterium]
MTEERLQKILARSGVSSRRKAEELVLQGRVSVNGEIRRELGSKADAVRDDIRVDGRRILPDETLVYLMLHKPAGTVTSLHDPEGRPTIRHLLEERLERLFPVGRLDYDSEGLLLVTNDGQFALRVAHPRYRVPKTYRVKVRGSLPPKTLRKLESGIDLPDGRFTPDAVAMEGKNPKSTWIQIIATEGRNRVIRRALEALGYPVQRLIRVAVGGVSLGDLAEGKSRPLKTSEIRQLLSYAEKPGEKSPPKPAGSAGKVASGRKPHGREYGDGPREKKSKRDSVSRSRNQRSGRPD